MRLRAWKVCDRFGRSVKNLGRAIQRFGDRHFDEGEGTPCVCTSRAKSEPIGRAGTDSRRSLALIGSGIGAGASPGRASTEEGPAT